MVKMSDTEISLLLLGETFRTKFWRCWEKKKDFDIETVERAVVVAVNVAVVVHFVANPDTQVLFAVRSYAESLIMSLK